MHSSGLSSYDQLTRRHFELLREREREVRRKQAETKQYTRILQEASLKRNVETMLEGIPSSNRNIRDKLKLQSAAKKRVNIFLTSEAEDNDGGRVVKNEQPVSKTVCTLKDLQQKARLTPRSTHLSPSWSKRGTELWMPPSQSQGEQVRSGRSVTLTPRRKFELNPGNIFQKDQGQSVDGISRRPTQPKRMHPRILGRGNSYKSAAPQTREPSTLLKVEEDAIWKIDIPCINCQQMVEYKDIDQHSQVCTKVNPRVKMVERPDSVHQSLRIEGKCQALMNAVERKLKQGPASQDEAYLSAIQKYGLQLLEIDDYDKPSLMKCRVLWQDILFLYGSDDLQSFSGSPSALIYLDRLRNLVKEKFEEIGQALEEMMQKSRLTSSSFASSRGFNISPSFTNTVEDMGGSGGFERSQRLKLLKQEKLRKLHTTISERQQTIDSVMRNSEGLQPIQKEMLAGEIRQGFEGSDAGNEVLFPPGLPLGFEIVTDLDSSVGKPSHRALSSAYSSTSSLIGDDMEASIVYTGEPEVTKAEQPEEQELPPQQVESRLSELQKDQRMQERESLTQNVCPVFCKNEAAFSIDS